MTLSHRVRTALAFVASCLALALAPNAVTAEEFSVILDQAKIMRLPDKVATIVIGNPLVADGTLQAGGMLVVTGKGYGTTNLIALDPRGAVLAEYTLKVTAPKDGTVTVWRGVQRETWSCADQCERAVVLGDTNDYFSAAMTQARERNSTAAGTPSTAAPK